MTLEVVIIVCIAMYSGVELVKHLAPSYYERMQTNIYSDVHERMKAVEKKIEEIVGDAK